MRELPFCEVLLRRPAGSHPPALEAGCLYEARQSQERKEQTSYTVLLALLPT